MEKELDQVRARKEKLEKLKGMGVNPYPYSFKRTAYSTEIKENYEEFEDKKVKVCGRIKTRRLHGKAGFVHIEDDKGEIQIYFKYDTLREKYSIVKLLDLGDFIGVEGKVFRTKTGEITVWAEEITLLSKALHPPPEKWHGIKDVETRYRQRYLDLMSNKEIRGLFRRRAEIIKGIREFLDERGFVEVETPILQPVYGGAFATPFTTYYIKLKKNFYLRISDELYLKRLIIGGYERVYEIGKNFRNEGIDRTHNPEFTAMEVYQAYADYRDMMELFEDMVIYLARKIYGKEEIQYDGKTISLKKPWRRISYFEALKKYTGEEWRGLSFEETKKLAEKLGLEVEEKRIKGKILESVFERFVEPELIEPAFVVDYPADITPLAKNKRDDPGLVERFEAFIGGVEVANAYSELNDPEEQERRFEEQLKLKEREEYDRDFVRALYYGMPPTGGLGVGIDRLVMILLNAPSIREVILFPQLREE